MLKLIPCNVEANQVKFDGYNCIRVVKGPQKLNEYDENTFAKIDGESFYNGTIKVKVYSRVLLNAPDFSRGFIGLAFRISDDNSKFESWYIRPSNGPRMTQDPVRLSHGSQYFSYPNYTFSYFRSHNIYKYDSPADVALNEWINLTAKVHNEQAKFYVNNQLVLSVDKLIHSCSHGGIGLFVDIGTEGFFRDLDIISEWLIIST